jgi:hypothetical protein
MCVGKKSLQNNQRCSCKDHISMIIDVAGFNHPVCDCLHNVWSVATATTSLGNSSELESQLTKGWTAAAEGNIPHIDVNKPGLDLEVGDKFPMVLPLDQLEEVFVKKGHLYRHRRIELNKCQVENCKDKEIRGARF